MHRTCAAHAPHMHRTCTAHALHMFFDIDTQSHHSGMGSAETWLWTTFRQSHQVQGSHTRYALPLKPCMAQLLPGTPKLRETVPRKRCQVLHGPPNSEDPNRNLISPAMDHSCGHSLLLYMYFFFNVVHLHSLYCTTKLIRTNSSGCAWLP